MKKNSLLAKILILILCLALTLSACGSGAEDKDDDAGKTTTAPSESVGDDATDPSSEPSSGDDESTATDPSVQPPEDDKPPIVDETIPAGKLTIELMNMVKNVLYINEENGSFVNETNIEFDAEEISFAIFGKDSQLAVSAPDLFGDEVYGVDLSTLFEDLPDSAIWEVTGISYEDFIAELGLSEMSMSDLLQLGTFYLEVAESLEETVGEMMGCVELKTSEGTVTIQGKEVEATVISFALTSEDLLEIANIMVDWYEEVFQLMNDELSSILEGTEMEDILSVEIPFDELRQAMEDIFAESKLVLEGQIWINANEELMRMKTGLNGSFEGSDSFDVYFDLVLGADPSNSEQYSLEVGMYNSDGSTTGARFELNMTHQDAVDEYVLDMIALEYDEETTIASAGISYNNDTDAYVATVTVDEFTAVANGTFKMEEDLFDWTMEKIVVDSETVELNLHVRYEAVDADEIPEIPAFTNVVTMDKDKLESLIQNVISKFEG